MSTSDVKRPDIVFHLTSLREWNSAKESESKTYLAATQASEGFMHASTAEQVLGTANAYYKNATDLILLEIDAKALGDDLKWEPPASPGKVVREYKQNEYFPHLYAPLQVSAVLKYRTLTKDETGVYVSF